MISPFSCNGLLPVTALGGPVALPSRYSRTAGPEFDKSSKNLSPSALGRNWDGRNWGQTGWKKLEKKLGGGSGEHFLLRRLQLQGTTGPIEKAVPEWIIVENAVNITAKHAATWTHGSIKRLCAVHR